MTFNAGLRPRCTCKWNWKWNQTVIRFRTIIPNDWLLLDITDSDIGGPMSMPRLEDETVQKEAFWRHPSPRSSSDSAGSIFPLWSSHYFEGYLEMRDGDRKTERAEASSSKRVGWDWSRKMLGIRSNHDSSISKSGEQRHLGYRGRISFIMFRIFCTSIIKYERRSDTPTPIYRPN